MTNELKEIIYDLLSKGVSIVKIGEMEGMPSARTLHRRQDEDEEFGRECARSREIHTERIVDRIENINDKLEAGQIEPQAANIISSNIKWFSSKHFSKRYGDKQQVDVNAKHNVTGNISGLTETLQFFVDQANKKTEAKPNE